MPEPEIHQLPIPEWNLPCPRCGYSLNGLPEHRCPECGLTLDMAEIVRSWTQLREPEFTGHELPFPDFNLHCPECGAALAGAPEPKCPACATPFDPRQFRPSGKWFRLEHSRDVPLPVLELSLEEHGVPFVRQSNMTLRDAYMGPRPFSGHVLIPRNFFFEAAALLQHLKRELEAGQAAADQEWVCPACRESNPGNFQLCWNCNDPRPQQGADADNDNAA